jgi:hypothetical protein
MKAAIPISPPTPSASKRWLGRRIAKRRAILHPARAQRLRDYDQLVEYNRGANIQRDEAWP